MLLLPPTAEARVEPERWSAAVSVGFETYPNSVGRGLDAIGLFGLAGTVRVQRLTCFDARFGFGSVEDGSDTTRLSESRLRFDLRPAFCPALHRVVTLVLGAGPSATLSSFEARVREAGDEYSSFTVGVGALAAALLRLGPVALRGDVELAVLGRFTFGMFLGAGVAL